MCFYHCKLLCTIQHITMEQLKESIDKQIQFNRGKNIFCDCTNLFRLINKTTEAALRLKDLDKQSVNMLVDYTTDKAIEEFCRVNQYYSFSTDARNSLRKLYSKLFQNLRSYDGSEDKMAEEHYSKLKNWLKKYNPFAEQLYVEAGLKPEPVVCSEYSSKLQIDILQIDEEDMMEPVLDIGCGKQGNLVQYLNQKGVDAFGIDRFPFSDKKLQNSNWLEYAYGSNKWGTIISNLGFSNHFKHHHLREDGNYIEYAQKYMEILGALKTGGRFYYAPDLPFIEQYLSQAQYKTEKSKVGTHNFCATTITRLR